MKEKLRGIMIFMVILLCMIGGEKVKAGTKNPPTFLYMTDGYQTMEVENTEVKMACNRVEIRPYRSGDKLYVPVTYIASGMNGSCSYSKKTKKTTIKIDQTTFIFTKNKNTVTINGKKKNMKGKAVIKDGCLFVPASIFKDQLKTMKVTVYKEKCIIFRSKSSEESYTKDKMPVGNCTPDDLTWKTMIDRFAKGKEASKAADQVLDQIIKPGMSDLEKVMAVNDYLVEHTTYTGDDFSVFGPLLTGTGVCQGYAFSTELLLNKAGVECIRVEGYAGVDAKNYNSDILDALRYGSNLHEWNMVKINGNWYHLDVTHNDATVNNKESNSNAYQCFLLSDDQIAEDHVWRRAFYKKASTPFYDENEGKVLQSKEYPIITGTICLPDGVTAPKGGIQVSIHSYGSDALYYDRVYVIPEGKNKINFQAFLGKKFDKQLFMDGFTVKTTTRGYETLANIVDSSASNYKAVITPKAVNLIQGKIMLPKDVSFSADYQYGVSIDVFQKVEGQNGMSGCGSDTFEGKAKADQKELYFDLDCKVPTSEYEYTLTYSIYEYDETNCPVVSYGYITEDGTITDELTYIRGSVCPLTSISIQVPKAKKENTSNSGDNGSTNQPPKGTELTKEVRKQIIQEMKKGFAGNRSKLSKLTTLKQAEKLIGRKPDETSEAENGYQSIYYYNYLSNGIKISNIFSCPSNCTTINNDLTVSNIEVTASNYMTILNELNSYLKSAVGAKEKAVFEIYNTKDQKTHLYQSKDKDATFKKIMNGTYQISASYYFKHEVYQVAMITNASGEIRVIIAKL